MIEKIDITNAGIISSIEGKLNVKNIRDGMFPTWRLTLQPGEEYDLGTMYYGMYIVRWGDLGASALIMIGGGISANVLLNSGASISTSFSDTGKVALNRKVSNGNVFVKNNWSKTTTVTVMQITNY